MDTCATAHQLLLSENYIVEPVENISVSMVDYEKMEMTQLIHSGHISNGTGKRFYELKFFFSNHLTNFRKIF